jgi:probable rRNA maturation factor
VHHLSKIFFFQNYSAFTLKERKRLKSFLQLLCKKEKHLLAEIRIIFCDSKEIRAINKKFLAHDYETDIITFPFSEKNKPIEGELYICIPRIKEQAKEWKCSFKEELHRVIFHGMLHLCGYNDKSHAEKLRMRERENYYLSRYFINVPRGT